MSHAENELSTAAKNEIIELIHTEFKPTTFNPQNLRPLAITRVQRTEFFPNYNNTYEGYFLDVKYASGLYEIWFAVNLEGSLADDKWFLERIR